MNPQSDSQPAFLGWLRRKWLRRDPLTLPFPPGWLGRTVDHPKLGRVFQLRDDRTTPPEMYFVLNRKAWRAN